MADMKMDTETKARMMSLMPLAVDATYDFIPDCFKEKTATGEYIIPEDKWPTFNLRAMTNKEQSALRRAVLSNGRLDTSKPEKVIEASDTMHESVRKLIVGWSNIVDLISGNEYIYIQDATGGADKDKWDRIPDAVKSELFQHVCRMSGLVKVEGVDRMDILKRGL